MRARWVVGAGVALVVFVVVLTAGPAALQAADLSWPAWVPASVAAVAAMLVSVVKPIVDAMSAALGRSPVRRIEQSQQHRDLIGELVGPDNTLPLVGAAVDRALLGIHPAIPLPDGAGGDLSAELPTYVPRDIDGALRRWLSARTDTGGFALIVGPAAAGKTRCAYEALRATVPDWRLLMPGSGQQIADLARTNGDLTRTVIWLDDTHRFVGAEGVTPAIVRRLLADTAHPVLIVGTIWPNRFDVLTRGTTMTSDKVASGSDLLESRDVGADSRQILDVLATRFDVAGEFSSDEMTNATAVARVDPRLAEALRDGTTRVAEILSAAPELVRRWRHGHDPYGRAVVSAAVACRLCGYPEPIPSGVVEAVANDVLSGEERAAAAEDWFTGALAWARVPVRGRAAPLVPRSERVGSIDGDVVSDVLVQHALGDHDLSARLTSDRIWELVIDHADSRARLTIAAAARRAGRLGIEYRAVRAAADTGDELGAYQLGVLHSNRGEMDDAEHWYRRSAEAGNVTAMLNLGALLTGVGRLDEAEHWFRAGADTGDTRAMSNLGGIFARKGDTQEAENWYRVAALAGNAGAMYNLGDAYAARGDVEQAMSWFRSAAENGHPVGMNNLAYGLAEQGDAAAAEHWYRRAAESGFTLAMLNLGYLLQDQGDVAGAERWYQKAVDAGDTGGLINLGNLLRGQGKGDEAEQCFRRAVAQGDVRAMANLGSILASRGELTEAEHWYRAGAAGGDGAARLNLATLLGRQPGE